MDLNLLLQHEDKLYYLDNGIRLNFLIFKVIFYQLF